MENPTTEAPDPQIYRVVATAKDGFQVTMTTARLPKGMGIGHFDSLADAEGFMDRMRGMDTQKLAKLDWSKIAPHLIIRQ
jgi:hypothetical protein